ncbi:MAG TPA: hypothetical protein DEF51_18485 [Myxococcales bacterium]|nr:hypothetical protein [Myxococcales bacterium]
MSDQENESPEIEMDESVEETAGPAPGREPTEEELAQLAELDETIAKYTEQKRWSDVIKAIVAKAELHPDPAQKVELHAEAGRMYLDKSSNQAEAIKCFEAVLE